MLSASRASRLHRRTGTLGASRLRRRTGAEGTVLLLFPAAVLAVLVLAAVTLDVGLTHVRAQQLRSVAASAANDAVGALDADALRSRGVISFDPVAAERLVRYSVAAGPLPQATLESVTFTHASPSRWEIAVTLSMDVRFVIAPALPGAGRGLRITVTEKALALVGDGR